MDGIDKIDKALINALQGGFPICDNPYEQVANQFNLTESELLKRIESLLKRKILTRFGPMYDIQKLGGAFSLCAMRVPEKQFEEITQIVNRYPEVAHNYKRQSYKENGDFNMWFVLATEDPEQIQETCDRISKESKMRVYNMPKQKEFFVGLHFTL